MSVLLLAAELGIEPRQRDSETLVLPLHNSAKLCSLLRTDTIIPYFFRLSRDFWPVGGGLSLTCKKILNNLKKGVDFLFQPWYNIEAWIRKGG